MAMSSKRSILAMVRMTLETVIALLNTLHKQIKEELDEN